jgi:hypothetical protein
LQLRSQGERVDSILESDQSDPAARVGTAEAVM